MSFYNIASDKYIPWTSLRYSGLILAAGNITCMKDKPDFVNYLPKSFFSGNTGIDGKVAKSSRIISEIWQTFSLYISPKWTTASFCLLPYFEAKQSKVGPLLAREKISPKPVPGRGCPSLKLRLSSLLELWVFNVFDTYEQLKWDKS